MRGAPVPPRVTHKAHEPIDPSDECSSHQQKQTEHPYQTFIRYLFVRVVSKVAKRKNERGRQITVKRELQFRTSGGPHGRHSLARVIGRPWSLNYIVISDIAIAQFPDVWFSAHL